MNESSKLSKVINWFDINCTENDNEYGITSKSRCLKYFVLGESEKNEEKKHDERATFMQFYSQKFETDSSTPIRLSDHKVTY